MCCGGIGGAWWPEPDEQDLIEEILSEGCFNLYSAEDLKKECDNPESDNINIFEIFNFLYENTSMKDFCGDCDEDDFREQQFEEFKKNIKDNILTLKYNGDLIGYAQFSFADNLGCVYLRNLVIYEDYRRLGIGTHVFNNVKGHINKKFNKIIIESDFVKNHDGAYEFFKRLKFKEDSNNEGALTYFMI